MKMYILVKDSIPLGLAITAVGHAAAAACIKWHHDQIFADWAIQSFKKVICKVNDKEFENAKKFEHFIPLTESAIDHKETALVFKPREEWPKAFKFYKLYK